MELSRVPAGTSLERAAGRRARPARERRRKAAARDGGDPGPVAALRRAASVAAASADHRAHPVVRPAEGGAMSTGRPRVEPRHETFAQQAVDDAVERERARMARELHDGVATELAGAISLFKVYMERTKDHHDEALSDVLKILERSLKQVREALTNVRRHSGSATCRVKMGFAARPFLIEVSDEGRGFAAERSAGYGLMGMRERAAGIGARLEVVSTPGRGTTVFLFGPN